MIAARHLGREYYFYLSRSNLEALFNIQNHMK